METDLSDDITSLRVHVHGFVQGIGFRDFLVMAAEAQKLDGWVRNRADGTVDHLPLLCRIDTLDEVEYFRHGGILHYVLRSLLKPAA